MSPFLQLLTVALPHIQTMGAYMPLPLHQSHVQYIHVTVDTGWMDQDGGSVKSQMGSGQTELPPVYVCYGMHDYRHLFNPS